MLGIEPRHFGRTAQPSLQPSIKSFKQRKRPLRWHIYHSLSARFWNFLESVCSFVSSLSPKAFTCCTCQAGTLSLSRLPILYVNFLKAPLTSLANSGSDARRCCPEYAAWPHPSFCPRANDAPIVLRIFAPVFLPFTP